MNTPVGFLSLRVNEVCNLRCNSCAQWGENGHILKRVQRGEKLNELSLDICKKLINEVKHQKPFVYVWGGEPSMWKPALPFFEECAKSGLMGSIVSNGQALDEIIEDLIGLDSFVLLFLSLDGWDADSQNKARSPAGGNSRNFEKVMALIEKVDEIKRRKGLHFPLIAPITVISKVNYEHLADIHRLVQHKTQLHPLYWGWYITEERAQLHIQVFEKLFGYKPHNHAGFQSSSFDGIDPEIVAEQVRMIKNNTNGSIPHFLPHFENAEEIKRYYTDHSWDCGYPSCRSIYYNAEINPDGMVAPCRDYQDYFVGNIYEQDFFDIWWGEKFKKFRRALKQGLLPVCTRCCGLQGF
ncbi:MAG: radical SAM protein [Spirochaetales bacterium]|nr:radical SAM protein [Spirochaetales bacterium]